MMNHNNNYYQNQNYNQQNIHPNQNTSNNPYYQQQQNYYNHYQMPQNMYQPNHLGQQFQRPKSKKTLIFTIISILSLLILGIAIWFFFFKKDIDDYLLEEQIFLALQSKVQDVVDSGDEQEIVFAYAYLNLMNYLMLDNSTENEFESVNDTMTTIENAIIDLMYLLEFESNEELKNELSQDMNTYITESLKTIKYFQNNLNTMINDIDSIEAKTEVQKATKKEFKQGVMTYITYLKEYEKYLNNPSNKQYAKSQEMKRQALVHINNSIVEYIRDN